MRYTSIYYNPSLYSNYLAHNESGTPKNPRGGKYLYITENGSYIYEKAKTGTKAAIDRGLVPGVSSQQIKKSNQKKALDSGKKAMFDRGLVPGVSSGQLNSRNQTPPVKTQPNQPQTEEPAVTQAPEPWWKQTLNNIRSWGEKAWSDISGTVVSAVQAVGKGFNTAKTWVTNAVGSVGRFATNAYNSVLGVAQRIGATFEDFARGVREGYARQITEGGRAYNLGTTIGGIGRGITDTGEYVGGFAQGSFGTPIDTQVDPNSPYTRGHSAGSVVNKLVVEPTAKLLNFGNQKLVQPAVNKIVTAYNNQQADYVKNSSFMKEAVDGGFIDDAHAKGIINAVADGRIPAHEAFQWLEYSMTGGTVPQF